MVPLTSVKRPVTTKCWTKNRRLLMLNSMRDAAGSMR